MILAIQTNTSQDFYYSMSLDMLELSFNAFNKYAESLKNQNAANGMK